MGCHNVRNTPARVITIVCHLSTTLVMVEIYERYSILARDETSGLHSED
jgi:hypothetical protein